jgi:hypothetical protein
MPAPRPARGELSRLMVVIAADAGNEGVIVRAGARGRDNMAQGGFINRAPK